MTGAFEGAIACESTLPEECLSTSQADSGDHGLDKNRVGGWAASRDAVVDANTRARSLGVQYVAGEAETLLFHSASPTTHDVRGVLTTDGRFFEGDVTVLATGSWTPKLLPELKEACLPTGQTVATIQLTPEERERYKDMPVSLFMDTGL